MPGLDIHAGIWAALEERGIVPTEVVGTSAGAVVSAVQAAGRPAAFMTALLNGLRDSHVRREIAFWKLRIPWLSYFLENNQILALLRSILPARFDLLKLPFSAWATREDTGESIDVAKPDISPSVPLSVMASMSICGVFPSIRMDDGHSYIDGGVRRNLPLPANWRFYDDIWLLIASGRPSDYAHRRGILTNLIRNVEYLMQDQILDILEQTGAHPKVHVVWPQVRVTRGMLRFDHALIRQAYRLTLEYLDRKGYIRT